MPARKAETVYRELLHATGKVDGKVHRWVVGVFSSRDKLLSHASMLKAAYSSGDVAEITKLDPHSPATGKDTPASDVKVSASVVQYNPIAPGLDEGSILDA